MVPRIQASNLRALTYSGVSRENAKYISFSLSFSLFFFFFFSFVFGEKIELQHIVVFNLYKEAAFCYFWGGKRLGTYETFLYP